MTRKAIEQSLQQLKSNGVEGPYRMCALLPYGGIADMTGWNAKTIWRKYKRKCRRQRRYFMIGDDEL